MPIYKLDDESGRFVPFEQTPFPDLEQKLEHWIEENPHLVLEGENPPSSPANHELVTAKRPTYWAWTKREPR